MHTLLMVLAHIFPDRIGLFLIISVIIVSYVWFRRSSRFLFKARFYRGLFILPLLVLAIIAIDSKIGFFALWLLYAVVLLINYVIPISKFIIFRLRIYFGTKRLEKRPVVTSDISFFKALLFGSHTPYIFSVETAKRSVSIGVLGSVSSSRYIFGRSTIVSQKFGNGKAYMIEDIAEIEKFEEDMEYIFPSIGPSFLGGKYKCDLPDTSDTDEVLLIIHPNSYVQEGDKVVGMGVHVGKYMPVSIKTAFAILKS